MVVPLILAATITAIDAAASGTVVLIGLLSVPPLLAALRCTPAATALMAVTALALAVGLGAWDGTIGELDHLVRTAVVAIAGSLAIGIARLREERERALAETRAATVRQGALIESAIDCVITMEVDGRVTEFNPAAQQTFGYSREDAIGRELADLIIPPALRERHRAGLARVVRGGESSVLGRRLELTGMRATGEQFPVELTVARVERGADDCFFIGFVRDITERRELERKLTRHALHDPLTGLANRSLFLDRLTHALHRLNRREARIALLFVDLDRFKSINDGLGHMAGDEVLQAAAGRLRLVVRPEDTVARFGGDEFAVLCEVEDSGDALAVAARIADALRRPLALESAELGLTASCGIAVVDEPGVSADVLLSRADTAMYDVKRRGGDGAELFGAERHTTAGAQRTLEAELRAAVARKELRVCYQPQVELGTGRMIGVEALVRWPHPTRGLLRPREFVPLAEKTGLIGGLCEVVLEQACEQGARWSRRNGPNPLTVAVNLSPLQLRDRGLPAAVSRALERSGLAPGNLCLELTEGTLVSGAPSTMAALRGLQDLGVQLAIDDFGTGYSSLGFLHRFPVDRLKIDRSFVERLGEGRSDSAIVRAIAGMGHALGLSVIAEGVERREQLELVRQLGCDAAQGYYLSRPRDADDVERLLREPAAV